MAIESPSYKGHKSRTDIHHSKHGLHREASEAGSWSTTMTRTMGCAEPVVMPASLRRQHMETSQGCTGNRKKKHISVLFCNLGYCHYSFKKKCFSKHSEHCPYVSFHLPISSATAEHHQVSLSPGSPNRTCLREAV